MRRKSVGFSVLLAVAILFCWLGAERHVAFGQDYQINTLKAMLRDGKVPVGITVTLDSSSAAEAMAYAGFDFLILDLEHYPIDIETIHQMVQATRGTNTTPVVRVAWNEHWLIKVALDTGAYGVMVPMVSTKDQALAAVRAAKYAPEGYRGFEPLYAALRWDMSVRDYVAAANREVAVIIQIETPQAVENLEEILSVPGIDLVLPGPGDLAVAMGGLDRLGTPEHKAALQEIYEACKRAGVPVGVLATTPEAIKRGLDAGYDAIVAGDDLGLLVKGAQDIVKSAWEARGYSSK